jgi:hypothetical protein
MIRCIRLWTGDDDIDRRFSSPGDGDGVMRTMTAATLPSTVAAVLP